MTKTNKSHLAALLLAVTVTAVGQEPASRVYHTGNDWVEEITGTLSAARAVRIKTYGGPIRIQGAQQTGVTYVIRKHVRARSENAARLELGRMRIITAASPEIVMIRCEGRSYLHGAMELDVSIPVQTASVSLQTRGGPILAHNIAGSVEAHTGGDTVQLDQIGADVSASTAGGDIEIGTVGGEVRVETGGGNIHVGSAGGQVFAASGGGTLVVGAGKAMTLETSAGSIHVGKCTGAVKASTGGGSIDMTEVGGAVRVESAGGSIRLGPMRGGVRAETGSGPIVADLAASRGNFTDSRLETSAGDIVVYIPRDLGVTIRAAVEMASGMGISTDFPELQISQNNALWGAREAKAEGKVNGGGPILIVHTATGNIFFKRKDPK